MTSEDFDESSSHGGAANRVLLAWEEGEGDEPSPNVRHFDPYLMPASEHLRQVAATMFADIEQHCPRPARQRSDARQRRETMVAALVANFALLPEAGSIALAFHAEATTRYQRRGFRPLTLRDVVLDLEERGWVSRMRGVRGRLRTELVPSGRLREMLHRAAATGSDLRREPGAESIILKTRTKDNGKVLTDYRDTEETLRLRAEMEAINRHLQAADIRHRGQPLAPPHLVRIFVAPGTAPEFTEYGRLFRAPWIEMKRTERRFLTIAGEPLVELDFKAAYVHLLYVSIGAEPALGSDPYAIPGLPRQAVKKAMAALLFRDGPIKRLSPELAELLPNAGWTAKRLTAAITDHHPAVAELLLGPAIGGRITRTESDILVAILLRLASLGIVGLPLHDCVLCRQRDAELVAETMRNVSAEHVGRPLPVEAKSCAEG